MKKASRIILALAILPFLVEIVRAATGFIGQIVQSVQLAAETTKVIGTVNVSAGQTIAAVTAITSALPAGSAIIGNVRIDQTTPGTTNGVVASIAAAQTIAVTNTGTFAVQTAASVSIPTVAKVAATTTSGQLIAANASRKGIEVDCDCANTDSVAINWGASAAVYASHKQLTPCSNWTPPPSIAVQTAIQIIANSGTQNCRVIEYP